VTYGADELALRESGDVAIGLNIDSSETNQAFDISNIAQSRAAADSGLQTMIDVEATARVAAVAALDTRISDFKAKFDFAGDVLDLVDGTDKIKLTFAAAGGDLMTLQVSQG